MIQAAKIIGTVFAITGLIGAGLGIGVMFGALILGVARNPAFRGQLFSYAILGFAFAFAEATRLFAFIMPFLLHVGKFFVIVTTVLIGFVSAVSFRGILFSNAILSFHVAETTGLFVLMLVFLVLGLFFIHYNSNLVDFLAFLLTTFLIFMVVFIVIFNMDLCLCMDDFTPKLQALQEEVNFWQADLKYLREQYLLANDIEKKELGLEENLQISQRNVRSSIQELKEFRAQMDAYVQRPVIVNKRSADT